MGIFAPISLKRAGVFKKSTTSLISCLTPAYPATSSKVVEGRSLLKVLAFERPIDMIPNIWPLVWRPMKKMKAAPMAMMKI